MAASQLHRHLVVSLLILVGGIASVVDEVHCAVSSPAPAPAPAPTLIFEQFEADAMNAIFQKWNASNPQLSSLFQWSLDEHPCNGGAVELLTREKGKGWLGVTCEKFQFQNKTGSYVSFKIIALDIYGSNKSCDLSEFDPPICGFMGIKGELPFEIGNLTNIEVITIIDNSDLIGPVPTQIWQLPSLRRLRLNNNYLSGPLPTNDYNESFVLNNLDLSSNNFSGSLQLTPSGDLFTASLQSMTQQSKQRTE